MSTPFGERWTVADEHNQIQGADIASAATITITHMVHYITGTAAIVTINLPWPTFGGIVWLVAAGAFTWTAAGNIMGTGTAVADKAHGFLWVPSKQKWYPLTIA
jgi:hypothetical protein